MLKVETLVKSKIKPEDVFKGIQVRGAARADIPSRTIDLKIPTDYYAKVKKAWTLYNVDPLVKFMVDRTTQYAVNGMEWQV